MGTQLLEVMGDENGIGGSGEYCDDNVRARRCNADPGQVEEEEEGNEEGEMKVEKKKAENGEGGKHERTEAKN
jgi:hypothetical protein